MTPDRGHVPYKGGGIRPPPMPAKIVVLFQTKCKKKSVCPDFFFIKTMFLYCHPCTVSKKVFFFFKGIKNQLFYILFSKGVQGGGVRA